MNLICVMSARDRGRAANGSSLSLPLPSGGPGLLYRSSQREADLKFGRPEYLDFGGAFLLLVLPVVAVNVVVVVVVVVIVYRAGGMLFTEIVILTSVFGTYGCPRNVQGVSGE